MIALLFLLPLVACRVHIDVTPPTPTTNASVRCSGSATWPITDTDQRAFHITDDEIFQQSTIFIYKHPSYVFVRKDQEHEGLTVTIIPTSAKIVDVKETPVEIAVKEFQNKVSAPTLFMGEFKEEVSEIISSSWSACGDLGDSETISLGFGNGRLSHVSSWGKQMYQSVTRTISADSGVEMMLQPGQEVQAVLKATKASLQVQVDFEASVTGSICLQYEWLWIIPDNRCYEARHYLAEAKLPHTLQASELISLDYYYGVKVEVKEDNRPYYFQP